jgi:uncharacterized membrane protein
MESRTKLFGHAIHPTLIVFPLGLFTAAVIFDLIRLFGGSGEWGFLSGPAREGSRRAAG